MLFRSEYGGRFRLAKVNVDENQELASRYGVRSIPDVVGFRDGDVQEHFLGAQPESQVRAFIDRLIPGPSEIERTRARRLRETGDLEGAIGALTAALQLDPDNHEARLDLIGLLIDRGSPDEAQAQLELLPPQIDVDSRVQAMRTRLAFSICAHVEAEILVVDEALAVGDIVFQRKCLDWIDSFRQTGTLLFVSHSMSEVRRLCTRAVWIEDGRIRQQGEPNEVIR